MPNNNRHPRGVAIMMVVGVVALCAVMGYAMLWGSATNVHVADNATTAARADALAESGINLAAYYLRYPAKAPAGFMSGDTYALSNISLGATVDGHVNLTVTRDVPGGQAFTITATGVTTAGQTAGSQTLTTTARLKTTFSPQYALSSQAGPVLGGATVITGGVQTSGQISITSPASIDSALYTVGVVLGSTGIYPTPNTATPVDGSAPTWAQLKTYGPTYTYNGATYTAQTITSPLQSAPPAADVTTNPLKIFYSAGDLAVFPNASGSASVTIAGSLVVNGKVTMGMAMYNNSRSLTINPVAGAPALVVRTSVDYASPRKTLQVNGLAWLGEGVKGIQSSNLLCNFNVSGALLVQDWPNPRTFGGSMAVTYNALRVNVPDFSSTTNQVPTAIILQTFRP